MWRAGRTEQNRAGGRRQAVLVAAALLLNLGAAGACSVADGRSETVEVDSVIEVAAPAESAGSATSSTAVERLTSTTTEPTSAAAVTPPTSAPTTTAAPPTTTPAPPTTVPSAPAPTTPAPTTAPEAVPFAAAGIPSERDLIIAGSLGGLGSPHARDIATAAMLQVRYDWIGRLPGWQVRFRDGRAGVRGLTFPAERVIEVYVRAADTPALVAHVLAHELGHAVDVSFLNDAGRTGWLQARQLSPATPWWVTEGLSDFASGSGDFAESFAWAFGPGQRWSGELAPPPTPLQVGLLTLLAGAA
jgi:hypothetical protein